MVLLKFLALPCSQNILKSLSWLIRTTFAFSGLLLDTKLWKLDTAISFVRFGALWKATKRTNAKMKFHFFVLATCITRQNEQTTKRNGHKTSFCRVVVLSFWRLVEVDITNKRQNEQITTTNQTLIFRGNFVVLSFRRAVGKATKRTNEEMKFYFWRSVVCSFKEIISDSLQSINFKVQR